MKRITKSVLALLLVSVVIGTTNTVSVMASTNNTTIVRSVENGITVTEKTIDMNYSEAVMFLIQKYKISDKEAESILMKNSTNNSRSAKVIGYSTKTKTYEWAMYTVEIGGIWEVYNEGSFRQINSLKNSWTDAIGSGNYTWNEFHVTDTTSAYPSTKASLSARGALEVAVDTSTSAEVSGELLGAGFSVGSTVGSTTYYRKVQNLSMSWSIY